LRERKAQPIGAKASGVAALGFLPGRRLPYKGLRPLHIVPFVTQYCIYFRGNPSSLTFSMSLSDLGAMFEIFRDVGVRDCVQKC
jgi:hypothetical protein